MEKPTHVVIVPSPWFSIQASIVEFSKGLIQHSKELHVTCLIPTFGSPSNATKALLQTLPSRIHYIFLPSIHHHDLPQDTKKPLQVPPILFGLTVTGSLPYIREALQSLSSSSRVVAMVVDQFSNPTQPIEIPDCSVPIRGRDLPKPFQDRTSPVYKFFVETSRKLHVADGILVNSFEVIEAWSIRALR
ncbi:hypothetical protein VNO78_16139 [Psophocarpus tetragonolobus]|uniref:Uncharacterized protein n=1 Tax=Psophocarpus tetragonolobus TaxID=3891 RepID=A0AAN9XJU0_PSOTE